MYTYLSDEWLAAMDRALRAMDPVLPPGAAPVVVRHVVTGIDRHTGRVATSGPATANHVSYTIRISPEGARLDPAAPDADADVVFTCDVATAIAIATGRERAQHAFMAGRLRLGGDARVLLAQPSLLRGLDDTTIDVRAHTRFPDGA